MYNIKRKGKWEMRFKFYKVGDYIFNNREDALRFRDIYYFKERFLYRDDDSVYHYNAVREETIEIESFDYIYAEMRTAKDKGNRYYGNIKILPRQQRQEHEDYLLNDLTEFYHKEKFDDKTRKLKYKMSYLYSEEELIVKFFIPVEYAKTITKDVIKDRLIKRINQFKNSYDSRQGDKEKKIIEMKEKYYKMIEELLKGNDNAEPYLTLFRTLIEDYYKEHGDKENMKYSQKLFNIFHDSIISKEPFSSLVLYLLKKKR